MRYVIVIFLAVFTAFLPELDSYGESIQEETFRRLDKIREGKKQQLFDYLDKMRNNADALRTDSAMSGFFHIKNRYYHLRKTTPPPEILVHKIDELKQKIREHYLRYYLAFYDILFIDKDGDIFYTIRKQADYHKNLFQGELAGTALGQQLKKNPRQTFVDYQYYAVSGEPSAFLIVPALKEGRLEGGG